MIRPRFVLMLPLLAVLALLAWPAFAAISTTAPWTQEILVLTSATELQPILRSRKGAAVMNLGPNPIFCAFQDSAKAVINKSWRLATYDVLPLNGTDNLKVYCICSVAQVTGGGTILLQGK